MAFGALPGGHSGVTNGLGGTQVGVTVGVGVHVAVGVGVRVGVRVGVGVTVMQFAGTWIVTPWPPYTAPSPTARTAKE